MLNLTSPIAQTLLLPLYAKAVESQVPNPILYDQSAIEIVAGLDEDLSQFNDKKSTVGTALRAKYLDDKVRAFIQMHDNAIVVNVGCGLDDRAGRIGELGKKTLFYQVDIDEVIDIRTRLLPAKANEILLVGSILASDWLDELAKKHPDNVFIFIIEGVLMYFDEQDNRQFLQAIAERFNGAIICFDMASTLMARHSDKHTTVGKTSARFKFGIDNPSDIVAWHNKLKLLETKPYGDFDGNKRVGVIYGLMMKYFPPMHHCFSLLTYQVMP